MQTEIIAAGKIIELIFSYHAITRFIDYRDRPRYSILSRYFLWQYCIDSQTPSIDLLGYRCWSVCLLDNPHFAAIQLK